MACQKKNARANFCAKNTNIKDILTPHLGTCEVFLLKLIGLSSMTVRSLINKKL